MIRSAVLRSVVVVALAPVVASAQGSRGRDVAQRVERLGKVIELNIEAQVDRAIRGKVDGIIRQSISGALRAVDAGLAELDRIDWNQNYDWPRGRESRSRQDWRQGRSEIDTTFAFPKDGTIDLTTFNGDITVTGWTRAEARVRASSDRGSIRSRFTPNRITLESEVYRGRGETTYELSVPQGVRVILRSMSGDLTVRGVKGSVDAHTNNGDVEVTDAAERIDIGSLSGNVTATLVRGEVEAGSLNGTVTVRDVEGRRVRVESTSGDIEMSTVRSRDIEASTVSGDVTFSGQIDAGGTYSFQSHSGDVTLRVPSTVSARFSIETFSGELDSEFPVTLQPNRERRMGRRLEFTVGSGEARVIVESFAGSINIRREQRR